MLKVPSIKLNSCINSPSPQSQKEKKCEAGEEAQDVKENIKVPRDAHLDAREMHLTEMEKSPGVAFLLPRRMKAPTGCDISFSWASLRLDSSWYQLDSRRWRTRRIHWYKVAAKLFIYHLCQGSYVCYFSKLFDILQKQQNFDTSRS